MSPKNAKHQVVFAEDDWISFRIGHQCSGQQIHMRPIIVSVINVIIITIIPIVIAAVKLPKIDIRMQHNPHTRD